jgi:hypothetical protein
VTKKNNDELEKATEALTKLDEWITTSLLMSAGLAIISRKPAHLASLGTAYLFGQRTSLVKDYNNALKDKPDTYPGLFSSNATLNQLSVSTISLFKDLKGTYDQTGIPDKLNEIQEKIDKGNRKK